LERPPAQLPDHERERRRDLVGFVEEAQREVAHSLGKRAGLVLPLSARTLSRRLIRLARQPPDSTNAYNQNVVRERLELTALDRTAVKTGDGL
jgi:hypothetical protein